MSVTSVRPLACSPVSPASTSSRIRRNVRRLVRPITSPIDGRVADINRRVDDARQHVDAEGARLERRVAKLEEAVGSFAEATTEATSYVGIELGRLAGIIDGAERAIQEFGAPAQEDYHRRRLAESFELRLEQLDGYLAAVLNHAAGHRGFAAQADLWFNPPLTVELSEGRARLTTTNERIAELPFAMMALGRLGAGARILDVGSAESTFPLSAASLGFQVTAVDPRGLPYEHPNLETVSARFEDLKAPAERFDAVFLISTIEHVGLPAYGIQPHGEVVPGGGADREMLDRIRAELIGAEGIVVITTPYGRVDVTDFERTYDDAALARLLEGWEVLERIDMTRRGPREWNVLPDGGTVDDDGVAMLVARPVSS
jgi:2-polyprenyl-3-methyl-5-hydroxy-6-metoxy-1,4-benzoquinol methylase